MLRFFILGLNSSATKLRYSGSTLSAFPDGNAEDVGDIQPVLQQLQNIGFSVFAYDYRGYGTSQGKPSERNAYRDIDIAYNYLIQQLRVPAQRIIAYGRSVG